MTETRRKLTTIFSADVQDYTRLMGADEEGTLATLGRYRKAMTAVIEAHGGRVINTWGDGLIADFPSVVEAVRAAVDTQTEIAGYNSAAPADKQMLYRIGINLGDVIEVGDDIYGDGVNIAARLQSSAPPGGIVISSSVYEQVRNKIPVGFEFLGALSVKNVEEGVPSYAVQIGVAPREPHPPTASRPATVERPIDPRHEVFIKPGTRRFYGLLGLASLGFLLINLAAWDGNLWSKWPILVFAVLAGLQWSRTQSRVDRRTLSAIILGLGIIGVNLMTWDGGVWAQWPLLGLAILVGLRWTRVRR